MGNVDPPSSRKVRPLDTIGGQREGHAFSGADTYRDIFQTVRVAVWDQDFSAVFDMLEEIRASGVTDIREYLLSHPAVVPDAIGRVRIKEVNAFALELFEAERMEDLVQSLGTIFLPETVSVFSEEMILVFEGGRSFTGEAAVQTLKGKRLDVAFSIAFEGDRCEHMRVSLLDISAQKATERALREQTRRMRKINKIAKSIASDLNLERIVQTVTDTATDLSGAQFGAFFYNVTDAAGERYTLFVLSGAPRESFEKFGLPRNTAVFAPTFAGTGIVRSGDIRQDPRYGKNSPHFGMPKGHLPVVSYLAVPVVSRSGEVHGGLFFGHDQPDIFTPEAEEIVSAIAAHAAIAIDNAKLLQKAEEEAVRRQRAELAVTRLAAIVSSSEDAIISTDLRGTIESWNRGAEQLYGYEPGEVIGRSVTLLLPDGSDDEETEILGRILRGERIEPYETRRQCRDGRIVHVLLTASPVRDADGKIVGASKIGRDITDRVRAREQQQLLLREMDHRIKNLFALASGIAALSARSATSPQGVATAIRDRLAALARSHALIYSQSDSGGQVTTMHELVRAIGEPYSADPHDPSPRVKVTGDDLQLAGNSINSLALLLHEFASNAAKYGAFSLPSGRVEVICTQESGAFRLSWREQGGPGLTAAPTFEGFGSLLTRIAVADQLRGTIERRWNPEGLTIELTVPLDNLQP